MRVLAVDVGGTKVRLGLFVSRGEAIVCERDELCASAGHDGLEDLIASFLGDASVRCERAWIAVAGPVAGRVARTTNLPWTIDADALAHGFGFSRVRLLNDLEATAWSLDALDETAFHTLREGDRKATGNRAVIAAGTGLGEAGLFWDGSRHRPFATEGGHADFAPGSALEVELRDALALRWGHVSWERLVSGPGLVAIHDFLATRRGAPGPPADLAAVGGEEPAAAIVAAARVGDPLSLEAVALFVRLYGAEAGNLALKHMATGGVYVAGGMAPKMLDLLAGPDFAEAFLAKGRMRVVLERIPLRVVLDERAPLLGAARAAFAAGGGG